MRGIVHFTVAAALRLRDALAAEVEAEAQRGGTQMGGNTKAVDRWKRESQRGTTFARGGNDRMFKEQAAGPAKPGQTGKNQSPAPGARAARGGPKVHAGGRSVPASPGSTG